MAKPIIKTNLKGSDKIELKYNGREVDMTLSDFKLYLDEVLEPTNAVLTSTEPLRYKALLSQNAPIATTTNPTMVAGQIWTLDAYNVADAATIAALELVSGTLYAVGSKYRSATDQTLSVNAATTLSYDGSPYVVSTDVNGDFNPFVNTLGASPILSRYSVGIIEVTLAGSLPLLKTWIRLSPPNSIDGANGSFIIYDDEGVDNNSRKILIRDDSGIPTDGLGVNVPISIEIEVYP